MPLARSAASEYCWPKVLVREAKNRPYADCGVQYSYYVMDLDHREGTTKRLGLSRLAKRGAAKQVILDEIAKCDVVCANRHRERTYRRKQWTKAKEQERRCFSSVVEHFIGNEEVLGSTPRSSSWGRVTTLGPEFRFGVYSN